MELTKNEMKNAQENAYMYLVDKNQMIVTNLSTEFDDDEGYLAIIKYNRKQRNASMTASQRNIGIDN